MTKINPKTATKYQANTPELYLEHCRNGGSVAEFCNEMMVSRTTFDTWCLTYPAMTEAKAAGKGIAEGWWIRQARNHLIIHNEQDCGTTKFDTSLYKFIMAGRFGHTSDRDLQKRLEKVEERLAKQPQNTISTQYAQEADCYPDDDNKT